MTAAAELFSFRRTFSEYFLPNQVKLCSTMDFEKVCRLCLEERERLRPITAGEDTFLRDIFRNILQIEVSVRGCQ